MSDVTIADRYELHERLGVGGMSTVQRAFDRRLERDVAVKLLAEHLADDPQFVTRFRREALSAARLVHPNIVQVFDFGLDDVTGRQFIVMELIRGQSAAEILRDRGRLTVPETLELVTQACRGLDYAHRNGVVHRDVKPGNLLRAEDGSVKLADFGIAKALSDESSITQVGSVLGTASYLAPEQAHGEEAGPPADIYGLGVVTYQLLSGRLPYEAASLTELALKQQREAPPLLSDVDPEIPAELASAVDRALALEPDDRFASAESMRAALEDGARGIGDATGATRVVAPPTEVTRLSRTPVPAPVPIPEPAPSTGVAPRVPRPPRAPRPVVAPAAAPVPLAEEDRKARRSKKEKRGRTRRFIRFVLVILVCAIGGAVAVIATSGSSSAVSLRQVVYRDVNTAVQQIQQLVKDNTK